MGLSRLDRKIDVLVPEYEEPVDAQSCNDCLCSSDMDMNRMRLSSKCFTWYVAMHLSEYDSNFRSVVIL